MPHQASNPTPPSLQGEEEAVNYAAQSSVTTHPDKMCIEACQVYTRLVTRILHKGAAPSGEVYTKLDALKALSSAEFTAEEAYISQHPLFRNIALIAHTSNNSHAALNVLPTSSSLSSSGYVLHTLVAALYAFFATSTFEDGAVLVANMGDDADTVGAVYGGLAGAWYGTTIAEEEEEGWKLFWSPRVRE
ncbi:ADP-ribosylation/Crystallin J1 [Pterulicium gracile]|uniref:ADP-ribosylhydrolase ARH3 n=1 Tax=Pterulicium gracile TaxID=1884261 RepID=A0A5C3QUM8_9AGAR|nr:ADP-ribosylation/Crystallin J1 [Pterula gracilis]